MTGRFRNFARPSALMRLAVFPLLALLVLLVTGDSAHAAGSFNPINTSKYCASDTGKVNTQTLQTDCALDVSPGANSDIVSEFNIAAGDYNFGGVVGLSPTVPDDNAIPVGAILGELGSAPTLGLLSNPCSNSQLKPAFTFVKGTTDINNVTYPRPFGEQNDLAIMSGDNPPVDGKADVNPPPAVTQYPSFLNAIFDADWVDFGDDKIAGNGDDHNDRNNPASVGPPKNPIKPVFRAVATTSISAASNLWVVLQLVVFDRGTKLPNLPAIPPVYGFPSVVVLQTSSAAGSATSPAPSAVTDFCSPLATANVSYGVTKDNTATGPNEGGVIVRTLPNAKYQIFGYNYGPSQRDADGDGYENGLDPCPFNADSEWNPRFTGAGARPGDSDAVAGSPLQIGDGIPSTCDSTPTEVTYTQNVTPGVQPQPTDHDGDGFLNSGDNCPMTQNPDQKDTDKDAAGEEVGDGIGNACDTPGTDSGTDVDGRPIPARTTAGKGPDVPDGDAILCIKESKVVVGEDPNVVFSGCLPDFPAVSDADGDGVRDENDTCPNTPAGATVDIYGCSATQEATVPLGSIDRDTAATTTDTTAGGGVGGPASGIGSLSPVAGTVPAWAAIAAGLGAAGLIGSLGTLASRVVKRRRDL